jgi:hypothetical protein
MTTSDASDQPIVHTPGQWKSEYVAGMRSPWTFAPQIGNEEACFTAQVFNVDGNSIATMEATNDDNVATANARLMAAAPQLLQSLLHAMTLLRVAGFELNGTATDKMKEAIELATGQPYKSA